MQKVELATENEIKKIKEILLKSYPNASTELNFRNLNELGSL